MYFPFINKTWSYGHTLFAKNVECKFLRKVKTGYLRITILMFSLYQLTYTEVKNLLK